MLTFPNAKINIGLSVTGKRADGYHNLETVFYPVGLKDALELINKDEKQKTLHISGLPVASNKENNLIWKAYTLLQNDFPQIKELSVFLHKVIPMGAGLGGGSSDGAFMLCMLNDYFHIGLSKLQLEAYALQLGSDCPFFIRNKPAFASGRGELLEEVSLDLSAYDLQIVYPEIHISTSVAFAGIKPRPANYNLRDIAALPVPEWRDHIFNDFENALFPQFEALRSIKEQLYAQGALYASLSGSGSALYGIFRKGEKAVLKTGHTFNVTEMQ